VCAAKALRIGPGYILVDWEKCSGCGKCANACETGAIVLRGAAAPAARDSKRDNVVPIDSVRKKPAVGSSGRSAGPRAPAGKPTVSASGQIAWALPEALLVVLVAFALPIAASALTGAFADDAVRASLTHVANSVALAALAWYLAHRHGAKVLSAYRLNASPELRNVLLAVVVALGCRLFSMTYAYIVPPPGAQGPDLLTQMFGGGAVGMALTFALVAVVAPVLEEVLLRGVVLGALTRRIGTWGAILASAAVFSLLHLDLWSLLPFAFLGIGLGWLAVRGRSLWPAVLAHVLYNAAILAATFLYAAAR
jgi:membrane protease YdiL (CAAX protease family)